MPGEQAGFSIALENFARPGTSGTAGRACAEGGNAMALGTRGNHTERWIWRWISRERKARGISRAEFARRLGIRRETLYRIEEVQGGASNAATLLDALEQFGALGTIAEIDSMDWHGATMSLSKHEIKKYDAIAEDNNLSRGQVVRQLAAEGLLARSRPETPARRRRAGSDRLAFMEIGVWYDDAGEKIEVRSVSEGEPLAFTVKREDGDLFERLGRVLRKAGVVCPDQA